MKQAVIRKTLVGTEEAFVFNSVSKHYFVKNLSNADCLVSFAPNTPEANCFKVKAGTGEEVAISWTAVDDKDFYTTTIYVTGRGEIEVQSMDSWVN